MSGLPIRWRLTLWYSSILAVILLLVGVIVYFQMSQHLMERLDGELRTELGGIDQELEESSTTAGIRARLHRRYGHYEQFLFDIRYADGSEPLFTRQLGEAPFPEIDASDRSEQISYRTYRVGSGVYRIASRQIQGPQAPMLVRAAASLDPDVHELRELVTSLLVACPVGLFAAVAGGYLLARRSLAPIDQMTRMAREITVGRLNRRIDVQNRQDELGRLAITLNEMIGRLEKSVADMQRFTADAAHELRTPITVMRNEAEVTLRNQGTADEYRSSLENLLEEFERLTVLADKLLYLSREDAGLAKDRHTEIELDKVVAEVVDHMRLLAQDKRIDLTLSKADSCRLMGDVDGLRRMTFNLLDNAIKYTPEGGHVELRLIRSNDHAEIVVADTGIGIDAEHLPHVCNRFYRVDSSSQSSGTGLGLAICRAIVESHNGQIDLVSVPGGGTTVTVTLNCPSNVGQTFR